ncbi:MAG: PLDc_N domain-containing protein [Clostridia bacterium]|nr:PLDc_N domain-containing protein [Clostridia bacterium]
MKELFTTEILLMIIPLFILQLSLALYCIVKILKEGVNNLSVPLWIGIVLVLNMVGPIAYLLIGRNKNDYYS